jgi:hypothetical protein
MSEILLTLKEYAHLFDKNYSAMRRRAISGKWAEARRIGNEWWVRIEKRDADAARNRKVQQDGASSL